MYLEVVVIRVEHRREHRFEPDALRVPYERLEAAVLLRAPHGLRVLDRPRVNSWSRDPYVNSRSTDPYVNTCASSIVRSGSVVRLQWLSLEQLTTPPQHSCESPPVPQQELQPIGYLQEIA